MLVESGYKCFPLEFGLMGKLLDFRVAISGGSGSCAQIEKLAKSFEDISLLPQSASLTAAINNHGSD